jgi:hypothetical protein
MTSQADTPAGRRSDNVHSLCGADDAARLADVHEEREGEKIVVPHGVIRVDTHSSY